MNTIRRWFPGNATPVIEVDLSYFPGSIEVRCQREQDRRLTLFMDFESGQGCHLTIAPFSSRIQVEKALKELYDFGVANDIVYLPPPPAPLSGSERAQQIATVIGGLFIGGLAIAGIIKFMSDFPAVPATAIITYLRLRSEGDTSHEAAAKAALTSGAWKALEQIYIAANSKK